MNFVFSGNAGTGKSVVAQLIGNSLIELKNKSKIFQLSGEMIVDNLKSDKDFLKKLATKGGVFVIDDAGELLEHKKIVKSLLDFVKEMADSVFILIGRTKDMNAFDAYETFRTQFSRQFKFEFKDYKENEMLKLLVDMTESRGTSN